jgi:hypothetical protein
MLAKTQNLKSAHLRSEYGTALKNKRMIGILLKIMCGAMLYISLSLKLAAEGFRGEAVRGVSCWGMI